MFRRLSSFVALKPSEWLVFLEAWCLFLKWDGIISLLDYQKWHQAISRPPKTIRPVSASVLANIIRLSEMAGRNHLRKMNCLRRCLCQKQLLNRRGVGCQIHFGVALQSNGKVKAHAWLSHQGEIINDSQAVVQLYSELTQQQAPLGALIQKTD